MMRSTCSCARLITKARKLFPFRVLLPVLLLASVFLSRADDGGEDGAGKIKVLIVEGVTNHAWEKRLNIVRAILAKDGSFDLDFTVRPTAAGDPAAWDAWRPKFSDYDVVISGYNNLGGLPSWPQEVKDSFAAYVHGGGGFYAFHEANNSFVEWPQYKPVVLTLAAIATYGEISPSRRAPLCRFPDDIRPRAEMARQARLGRCDARGLPHARRDLAPRL